MVHAGSNARGDVLFMEVCQKLGGLSLVGMGGCESTHLWCMLGVIQREMFSLWRYVRKWEVSVLWRWEFSDLGSLICFEMNIIYYFAKMSKTIIKLKFRLQ